MAINGGIATLEAVTEQLKVMDGVMVGRAAYQNPELLLGVDPLLSGEPAPVADGFEAVEAFIPYAEARLAEGVRLADMTRHMLGLFAGRPGARLWRRHLATETVRRGAGIDVLRAAMAHVSREAAPQAA
jgi:tRNA-dihydrouridine synthase A